MTFQQRWSVTLSSSDWNTPHVDGHYIVGVVANQTFFVMATKRLYSRNCLPSPGMQPIKFPSGSKESLFLLSSDGTVTDYLLKQRWKKITERRIVKKYVDPLAFRKACCEFAGCWIDVQIEEFKRMSIGGDFDTPTPPCPLSRKQALCGLSLISLCETTFMEAWNPWFGLWPLRKQK